MGNVIDVRDKRKEPVKIVFSDNGFIDQPSYEGLYISSEENFSTDDMKSISVTWEEVDDLIEALKEAKKQWNTKE